jgi:hypothetical protein
MCVADDKDIELFFIYLFIDVTNENLKFIPIPSKWIGASLRSLSPTKLTTECMSALVFPRLPPIAIPK